MLLLAAGALTACTGRALDLSGGRVIVGGDGPDGGSGGGGAPPCEPQLAGIATVEAGPSMLGLMMADVDRDGRLDLVTVDSTGGDAISVFRGNGDDTFSAPAHYFAAKDPSTALLADLDGDGSLDAVVSNNVPQADPTSIHLLLGRPDGSFGPPSEIPIDPSIADSLVLFASGDFDRDGHVDVAATFLRYAFGDGVLLVFRGNGDGTVAAAAPMALSEAALSLAAADFDRDGNLDLVLGNDNVDVLMGRGDGTFAPRSTVPVAGAGEVHVVVADMNGDGRDDVVATSMVSGEIAVLLADGKGALHVSATESTESGDYHFAVAADVNCDGKLDVVYTRAGSAGIGYFPGNGDGTLAPARTFSISPAAYHNRIAAGDLDGDGRPEIMLGTTSSDLVTVVQARSR